ncbi:hypothetical protein BpHYR1_054243 [Brachionus plicatilis]|uniref:Uncharacterized protein n=1 Tax=Brachionus plicatilis TaxID=10195 RepID=A0A3M7SK64_BRAPC|nr:hypothetical protein BpHYR1_054243 [Brachionus plicatilis]
MFYIKAFCREIESNTIQNVKRAFSILIGKFCQKTLRLTRFNLFSDSFKHKFNSKKKNAEKTPFDDVKNADEEQLASEVEVKTMTCRKNLLFFLANQFDQLKIHMVGYFSTFGDLNFFIQSFDTSPLILDSQKNIPKCGILKF